MQFTLDVVYNVVMLSHKFDYAAKRKVEAVRGFSSPDSGDLGFSSIPFPVPLTGFKATTKDFNDDDDK